MQDFDDFTNDYPEVDANADALRPAVHFDTGVEGALEGVDAIDELVDDVIAGLPSERASPGPFQQTPAASSAATPATRHARGLGSAAPAAPSAQTSATSTRRRAPARASARPSPSAARAGR
jgi:hypothetical protein